jgi:nitric oxide reductase activation protein
MRHMNNVCKAARTSGIKVFGVGIENAYTKEDGKRMYGEGNFVVLKSVAEMGSVLGNAITRVVKESCVLPG